MTRSKTIKFSVPALEKLTAPEMGFMTYKDQKNSYLKLYVTSNGVKTFFVRKWVNGRDERIIIGRFPIISIEQARKKALIYCATIAEGKHPHAELKKQMENRLTFGKHFNDYLERYSKPHKKSWQEDKRDIEKFVSHWFKRELSEIKKSDVQKLQENIYAENGLYQANKILIRIRAIFNKAIEWGWNGNNPTQGIKKYKEKSRDRFVQPNEMPFLIRSLNEEPNTTIRDFFWMLLLTGARKTNVLTMQWKDICWERNEWRIPITKNGDPVNVPLIDRAIEILKRREENSKDCFVFSQQKQIDRHIQNPKSEWLKLLSRATIYCWRENNKCGEWIKQMECQMPNNIDDHKKVKNLILLAKKKNIILSADMLDIRLHDIRRTFGSYQALTGASLITIGKSLGHKSPEATQIYARLNNDNVRASIEKATSAMFE